MIGQREELTEAAVPEGPPALASRSASYLKNVSLKFLSGTVGFLLNTATGMIVARSLGAEDYGTASLLLLVPVTITWFASLGVGKANVYLTGTRKYAPQTLFQNSLFLAFIISVLIGVLGWIALPLFLPYFLDNHINRSMLILAFLAVPSALLEAYMEGLLLGLERIGQLSVVTMSRFLLLFLFNVTLILIFNLGIWGTIIAAIVTPAICSLLYTYFLRPKLKVRPGLNLHALKSALGFGVQGHLGSVLHFMNLRLDVFLVGFFAGVTSVGYYTMATTLAELLPYFSTAFSYTLFPRTASSGARTASEFTPWVARLSAFVTTLAAGGLFLLSRPLIIQFCSEEYLPSLYPLWLLLPGMISMGYAGVIHSDLSGRGKPFYSSYGALVSLCLTVVLDLLLIPRLDILGAAIASSIAQITNAALAVYFYRKETGIHLIDLLLLRKEDVRAGIAAGREMILSLNRALRGRRSLGS